MPAVADGACSAISTVAAGGTAPASVYVDSTVPPQISASS